MMNEPFDIVIFGGAGDLALRKLIPALYRAFQEENFCCDSRIIACCHKKTQAEGFVETAALALKSYLSKDECSDHDWQVFRQSIHAVAMDINDRQNGWSELERLLAQNPERVRVYYLAVSPKLYGRCCEHLSAFSLITEKSRLVVEKPIGYDGETAEEINHQIANYFEEKAIYRIDHYLGKETVQNLMALRFANVVFEQLWDAKSIEHVQISISETVGVEGRAEFYDGAGALRDMVQNHLLQLLCLVAMESPNKMNAHSIRAEKLKILEALRPIQGEDVECNTVRGQYIAGKMGEQAVAGYLEELGEDFSQTETFVALKVFIDNWRWARVPFYLRTGKRMKKRSAEIIIRFKDVSHRVYEPSAGPLQANRLVIRLQPEESMQLVMMAKNLEKLDMELQPVTLNLNFNETYKKFRSDAYKRLIIDAAAGNPSLFIHRDEVRSAWAWIDPIIEQWQQNGRAPEPYRAGSWGPDAADALLAEGGHAWFNIAESHH